MQYAKYICETLKNSFYYHWNYFCGYLESGFISLFSCLIYREIISPSPCRRIRPLGKKPRNFGDGSQRGCHSCQTCSLLWQIFCHRIYVERSGRVVYNQWCDCRQPSDICKRSGVWIFSTHLFWIFRVRLWRLNMPCLVVMRNIVRKLPYLSVGYRVKTLKCLWSKNFKTLKGSFFPRNGGRCLSPNSKGTLSKLSWQLTASALCVTFRYNTSLY